MPFHGDKQQGVFPENAPNTNDGNIETAASPHDRASTVTVFPCSDHYYAGLSAQGNTSNHNGTAHNDLPPHTKARDSAVTVFPHSDDQEEAIPAKRRAPADEGAPHDRSLTKFFKKRSITPPLTDDSFLFQTQSPILPRTDRGGLSVSGTTKPQNWQKRYQNILDGDQAGPCTVAHEMVSNFPLVTLKSRTLTRGQRGRVVVTSHPNLVNIQNFHEHETSVQIVYECMAVSLAEILALPTAEFREYEWAVVCKEVVRRFRIPRHELTIC